MRTSKREGGRSMRKGILAIIAAFVLGSLLVLASPSGAQVTTSGFQYVVKFICGDADDDDARGLDLNGDGTVDTGQFIARGEYSTVINVHNPNERFVNMFKKIALDGYVIVEKAFDPKDGKAGNITPKKPRFLFQTPGPIFFVNIVDGTTPPLSPDFPKADTGTRYFSLTPKAIKLSPDEAFQINCAEIRAVTNDYTNRAAAKRAGDTAQDVNGGTFADFGEAFLIKGYFVIFSEARLDVHTIYTACDEGTTDNLIDCVNGVQSLDLEVIKEDVVAPPSSLVPPKAASLSLLTAGGQELRVNLGAQSLSALSESRLMVYNLQGSLLHDSSFVAGTELSWRPLAMGRPLANGVYLYVIAVKDVFGRVGYQVGKFALLR